MNMKDILHNISDESGAEQSNLWYSIEQEMKEENLMRKSKNRRLHFSLTTMAALIGIIVIGSISFGRSIRPIYHQVTLTELETLATSINLAVTHEDMTIIVDWAYADPGQIVMAYTVFDTEGNALTGTNLAAEGRVELHTLWDDNDQYSAIQQPLLNNPNSTHQIVRYSITDVQFRYISQSTEGEIDLRQATSLNLRAKFFTDNSNDVYTPFSFNFEVPYRSSLFEQHNDLVDIQVWRDNLVEPVESVKMYFNDLIITESATSLYLCTQLPDDTADGLYFPGEVNLFVDNDFVEDNPIPNEFNPVVEINARYHHDTDNPHGYCGEFIWHIAFDTMPETIRIEIPSLRSSQIPELFENEVEKQVYIDLFAEQGYNILDDGSLSITPQQFPDEWSALDGYEQYITRKSVMDDFFEQFLPDEHFTEGWEYTFNIMEEEVIIWNPPYHPVTVADIEAMATPLNLTQTRDDITIQLDWAYVDANQIVIAYTPYDAEANPITGTDFDNTSILMHHYLDENPQSSVFGQQVIASNDSSSQQISRFAIPGSYFEFSSQIWDQEIDLHSLTSWNLRAEFRLENSDLWGPSYIFNFEVPFSPITFEQHNQLLEFDMWQESEEPVTDFELYFNDLVITDSATSVFMCMKSPDDVFPTLYFARDVNLYADGRLIETVESLVEDHNPVDNDTYFVNSNLILFSASYHRNMETPHATCAQFVWHMVFEELPSNIRIEIPGLRPMTSNYFVDEGQAQAYIDLFAEEGYDLSYSINDEPERHYAIDYSQLYEVLDEEARDEIFEAVWDAFNEIYPHDERYTADWEYTFELDSD